MHTPLLDRCTNTVCLRTHTHTHILTLTHTCTHIHTQLLSSSQKVLIMLEELKLPYELRVVDLQKGEQCADDFLAVNPNGV